jgi:hypothetical protein
MRRTHIAKRPTRRREERPDVPTEELVLRSKPSRLCEQLHELRDEIDALLDDIWKEV